MTVTQLEPKTKQDYLRFSFFTQQKINQADATRSPIEQFTKLPADLLKLIFDYAALDNFGSMLKKYYVQLQGLKPLLEHRSFGFDGEWERSRASFIFRMLEEEILAPNIKLSSDEIIPVFENSFFPKLGARRYPYYRDEVIGNMRLIDGFQFPSPKVQEIVRKPNLSAEDKETIGNEAREYHHANMKDFLDDVADRIRKNKKFEPSCFQQMILYFLIGSFSLTFSYTVATAGFSKSIFGGFNPAFVYENPGVPPLSEAFVFSLLVTIGGFVTLSVLLGACVDFFNIHFPRDTSTRNALTQVESLIEQLQQEIQEHDTEWQAAQTSATVSPC